MKRRLMNFLTTLTLITAGVALFMGFIASMMALGAYTFAKEISDRIDDLWADQMDDELDDFLNDPDNQ